MLAKGRTLVSGVLEHPWIVLLGEASYSLYLLHWIPIVAMIYANYKGLPVTPGTVWLGIGATIAASIAAYRYLESPLRRHFARRAPTSAPPAPENADQEFRPNVSAAP
ncbi:hypothetical protein D3C78_1746470 [compost metagenome]